MIRTVVNRPLSALSREVQETPRDKYAARLVKYVPAEVTAVFVLLAAGADQVGNWLLILVLAVGIVSTPLYLYLNAPEQKTEDKPLKSFYVLATIAFMFWALAVAEPVRELLHVETAAAEVLLGLAALLIPGVDMFLTRGALRRQTRQHPIPAA